MSSDLVLKVRSARGVTPTLIVFFSPAIARVSCQLVVSINIRVVAGVEIASYCVVFQHYTKTSTYLFSLPLLLQQVLNITSAVRNENKQNELHD
jgi:hypothetical protein